MSLPHLVNHTNMDIIMSSLNKDLNFDTKFRSKLNHLYSIYTDPNSSQNTKDDVVNRVSHLISDRLNGRKSEEMKLFLVQIPWITLSTD